MILEAYIIGWLVAMPVGPLGMLAIQRTLRYGGKAGFYTGIGIALADACFTGIASLSIDTVAHFLQSHYKTLHLLGSLILIVLAVHICRTPPSSSVTLKPTRFTGWILSAFMLTLSNPLTILLITPPILQLYPVAPTTQAITLNTLSVFLGSYSWWIVLTLLTLLLRKKLPDRSIQTLSFISGLALLGFALHSLWALYHS